MTSIQRPSKKVLISFFKGECQPAEATLIELYLALDVDTAFVQQCMQEAWKEKYWQVTHLPLGMGNNEMAWQKFQPKITEITGKPNRKIWRYVAAVFLLCFGSALFMYHMQSTQRSNELANIVQFKRYQAPKGRLTTFQLSDSSTATIFPGSSIELPDNFNESDRQIKLNGRAYFQIKHNPRKPFYVSSGKIKTKVLGTSFEINNGGDKIQKITLLTGKIAVGYANKSLAVLSPGQQLKVTEIGKYNINKVNVEESTSWIREKLNYSQAPLLEVCAELEKWYGINITIRKKAVANKKITASFTRKPLTTVLNILATTGDFRYTIHDNTIIIY